MRRALALALLAAACGKADTDPDPPCGPNGECPAGYRCEADSRCRPIQGMVVVDAAPPADAPLADGPLAEDAAAPPPDAPPPPVDAAAAPPDAGPPPPDAPVPADAAPPDATPTGTVSVVVRDGTGALVPGAVVAAARADGTTFGVATAGDAGVATVTVPIGGMATYAISEPMGRRLVTVAGLADGMTIDLGPLAREPAGTTVPVDVSWSSAQPGATQSGAEIGCRGSSSAAFASSATSITVNVGGRCRDAAGAFTIVGWAIDGTAANRIAYALAPDLPAATTQVALPAWKTDLAHLTVSVTGGPACGAADCVTVLPSILTADGRQYQVTGSGDTFAYPPGLGTTLRVFVSTKHGATALDGIGGVNRHLTGLAASQSFDLAADALPRISGAAVIGLAVSFTAAAPLDAADVIAAGFTWTVGTEAHRWVIFAPPGATTLRAPQLPPELAAEAPPGAVGSPAAAAFDTTVASGYAAALAGAGTFFASPPPGVTVRFSASGNFFNLLPGAP